MPAFPQTGASDSTAAQVNRLTTQDTRPQQLLLTWRSELEAGAIDRDALLARTIEEQVPADTLVAILELLPLAHPMDPLYFPVCGALWGALGEDLDACLKLPYATRIYMATYLGVLERPDDTKALVNSLENPDAMALGADIYHVSNQLADHEQKSELVAIWAWKKGATLRGPEDQAFVCRHTTRSCYPLRRAGDKDVFRREIIPWAEEALARPGSESRWGHAISGLVQAYVMSYEAEKGIARARYWLEEAETRGLPFDHVDEGVLELARQLRHTDDYQDAADMLRRVVREGDHMVSGLAQFNLVLLGRDHPDVEDVIIIPAQVRAVDPPALTISLADEVPTPTRITVRGSYSFVIESVACDVPFVTLSRPSGAAYTQRGGNDHLGSFWTVEVTLDTDMEAKATTGEVTFSTNDPDKPTIRVPLEIVGVVDTGTM